MLRGRGVLKAKIFQEKYEFPEGWGWGVQTKKNPPWGEYEYFLEQHMVHVQLNFAYDCFMRRL